MLKKSLVAAAALLVVVHAAQAGDTVTINLPGGPTTSIPITAINFAAAPRTNIVNISGVSPLTSLFIYNLLSIYED